MSIRICTIGYKTNLVPVVKQYRTNIKLKKMNNKVKILQLPISKTGTVRITVQVSVY